MTPFPLYIDDARIAGRLYWRDVVEALRDGHRRGRAEIGDMVLGPPTRSFLNRAAWIDGIGGGIKSVTVFTDNPGRRAPRPAVQGAFLLFDDDTGALKAIVDGPLLTKWKTAADSVLGAMLLARADAARAVIIGAGALASALAEAYAAAMPRLDAVEVWARDGDKARRLAASIGDARVRAAADDLETVVGRADIVSTATSSAVPILRGDWVRPGTHVDLVGAFRAEMREADDALMRKARLFVDSRETTVDHIGELIIPLNTGVIARDDILGDLYDLVRRDDEGRGPRGRAGPEDVTVFKNGGGAHLDVMTAAAICAAAMTRAAGAGAQDS